MYKELEALLDSLLEGKITLLHKSWATQQGFNMDYYCSSLSALIHFAPSEIRDMLCLNDKSLYKKCIAIRDRGMSYFNSKFGDALMGIKEKSTSVLVNDEGEQTTSVKMCEINPIIIKKFFTQDKIPDSVYESEKDVATIEKCYSIVDTKEIIPEKQVLNSIRGLQGYQFKYFKYVDNYVNNRYNESADSLYLNLKGGYQSGKTQTANTIMAFIINILANSKKKTGDYVIMGSTMSSIRRNIINRVCSQYPSISPPSINSNVWRLPGVTLNLITTQLISYHSLKGSSIAFCYCDELDACHPQVLDLLQTRFTEKFSSNKRENCCIFLTTSNPKNPDHHVTKFLYPDKKDSVITECVPTWENSYVTKEYLDRMEVRCGGKLSNKYRIELGGESLYMVSQSAVFPILEEETFVEDTIDCYKNVDCTECGSDGSYNSCKFCKDTNLFKKKKDFFKCHIGYDFGTSVQTVFVCTFFYLKDARIHALVLDSLIYEGGFSSAYVKSNGFEALERLREANLKDLIQSCSSICSNVELFIPHDAPHQIFWMQNVINKHGLQCKISRPPAPKNINLSTAIEMISQMFIEKRLHISSSCKTLKSQLFSYQYDEKQQELGAEEKVLKHHDHTIDAMRYSLIPMYQNITNGDQSTYY